MLLKFRTREQRLEAERTKLIDMALRYGLNDSRVIKQSQVVDRLIEPVQRKELRLWVKSRLA
jgi:hypothetical protein